MSEPFLGEIRMFGGNFAPRGWAICEGQLLPIAQNTALFSLIGTNYGGNGTSTFGLPDLRGRLPLHMGEGPGLSSYVIGEAMGAETVALTLAQLPPHSHPAVCSPGGGNSGTPVRNYWCTDPAGNTAAYNENGGAAMATGIIGSSGGGQAHDNMPPFLVLTFVIALQGIFPSRN